ncbi:MAG: hypothetical protein QF735_04105, partial [Phycisphaeraceae bacterium]|nr:hypothetical protein [Phycisphaeraceae bacterium]
GWSGFTGGLADFVKGDLASGENLTPAGHSHHVAMPGAIQAVKAGGDAQGGVWTGAMCLTYMFALMGIQSSPAFSMWAYSNKTCRPFRWQQVVASGAVVGIILFTFTIFQGLGGNILVANGTLEQATDKNLVPQLINLLSDAAPWLVGLLAVCALAAMQSTGAAYMSTFSGMVTRDLYRRFINPNASDNVQKLCGRIFVVLVTVAALVVAAKNKQAIVMLGGLAVAYGFQMYPALMGVCYFPKLTRRGVVWGLVAGLLAVTLTDKTVVVLPAIVNLVATERVAADFADALWGRFPLTIHSAGWGMMFNLAVTLIVSCLWPDKADVQLTKQKRHDFLQTVSGVPESRRKYVGLAWVLTVVWFVAGFGPVAVIGNTLFSNPNDPSTWAPLGLPSLWVWQLVMLVFGVFVMWFLAFHIGLSKPIPPEDVQRLHAQQFPGKDTIGNE